MAIAPKTPLQDQLDKIVESLEAQTATLSSNALKCEETSAKIEADRREQESQVAKFYRSIREVLCKMTRKKSFLDRIRFFRTWIYFAFLTALLAAFDFIGLAGYADSWSPEMRRLTAGTILGCAVLLLCVHGRVEFLRQRDENNLQVDLAGSEIENKGLKVELDEAKSNLKSLAENGTLKKSLELELQRVAQEELQTSFSNGIPGVAWDLEIFKREPLVTAKAWVNSDAWPSIPGKFPLETFWRDGIPKTVKVGCFRAFGSHCILLSINSIPTGFTNGDKRLSELVGELQVSFGPLIDELLKAGLKGSNAKISFTDAAGASDDPVREILFQVAGTFPRAPVSATSST